jgi:hypothetical protein
MDCFRIGLMYSAVLSAGVPSTLPLLAGIWGDMARLLPGIPPALPCVPALATSYPGPGSSSVGLGMYFL